MSQESVEVVQTMARAFNAGDGGRRLDDALAPHRVPRTRLEARHVETVYPELGIALPNTSGLGSP